MFLCLYWLHTVVHIMQFGNNNMNAKEIIVELEKMCLEKEVYIGAKSIDLLEINSIEQGESLIRIIPISQNFPLRK